MVRTVPTLRMFARTVSSTALLMAASSATVRAGSMGAVTSTLRWWPLHRNRTVEAAGATGAMAASVRSSRSGSTPSRSRRPMSRAVPHRRTKIVTEIRMPIIGSASGKPSQTPMTPATTARDVKPSVLA